MRLQRLPAAIAAFAIVSVLVLQAAPAPDLFDEIYARGKPLEATLKTLTARFTETSTSSLLARPIVVSGTIAVVKPSRIVMHYTDPDKRTVLIENDSMRVVWPARSIDQRTSIGSAQRRIQQYFVDKSPAQLRSHFDIVARDAPDRPAAWMVTLTPKRKQIKEGLSKLDLWLDRDAVMLTAMLMTFPNGDTKLMEFSGVVINPAIDPSVFKP
jgi:outer membrane lipoprotein-sorting protein